MSKGKWESKMMVSLPLWLVVVVRLGKASKSSVKKCCILLSFLVFTSIFVFGSSVLISSCACIFIFSL